MSEVTETTETPALTPSETTSETPTESTLLTPAATETPAVPEKYEFAPPEGLTVDPEALGGFEAAAREAGLSQDAFGKLATFGTQLIASKVAAAVEAALPAHLRPAAQTEWQDSVRNDPEFGGDKLAPSLAQAAKAIERFGGDGLREALNVTRAGNHPAVVRAFIQIGKALGDAEGLSTGKPVVGPPKTPEQAARSFYNSNGGNYPDVAA
jgi:hypothetical protein